MNIKEIAKLAGVSTSTVSKIVNQKDDGIRAQTRERVLKIVKEYNYTPYSSAVSPTQKTWTIGLLLRYGPSLDKTLSGILHTAQSSGYTVIVCNNGSDPEQELKSITALCRNRVDGILWEPVNQKSLSCSSYMQEKNIPYLTIGPDGGASSLLLPYKESAYRLTGELIARSHSRIACLLTEGRRTSAFLSGYKECLFENQIPLDEELIFYGFTDELLYKINTHQISGIISSHYQKALEFYQLVKSLHYRIPEDFSLISLKNDITETLAFPEISTYTVSSADFGSFLCQKLIAAIEKTPFNGEVFSQEYRLENQSTLGVPFDKNAKKIIVAGSINLDTYLNFSSLPHTGKTVSTSTSSVYPGGKGLNQSIGVSKLGHRVTLIGNVGSDTDSDLIYRTLNGHGVDTYGVTRCSNINTGKAYIFVEESGKSMISILTGANGVFTPEDVEQKKTLFENTGYCLIQSEIPLETVKKTCLIAREYGAKTILKPSACGSMTKDFFSYVDILVPNEDELSELCPDASASLEEKAASLLAYGIKTVIVTLGERGCFVCTGSLKKYFPAANFPSIDSTGASDAFISALASYLLYGCPLEKAVRIATYAAGFSISREGVVPALIDKNSLEAYIGQKEPGLLSP